MDLPAGTGADRLDLRTGLDGRELRLCVADLRGYELLQLARSLLPPRPGGVLSLWFGNKKLLWNHTLQEQGLQSAGMLT